MRRTISGLVLVAMLAFAAADARAGIVYLGLQGGVSRQKASLSGITFDPDTSFLYGVRAGVRVLSIAVELNYFQAAHNLTTGGVMVPTWSDRKVDYSYLGVNVRWMILPLPIINPYLTAGYGYYTADIHNIDKDKNGGFNVGAGVELMLGRRFSLLAEGKYHHVSLDIGAERMKIGNFTLSGGLNIYF
jgi:opacity protein-like surface antigen